jgi:glycosyl hydrolase family 2/Ig-like domain-containing protein/concanavalin A-like lectin/glucanase superfamily protein
MRACGAVFLYGLIGAPWLAAAQESPSDNRGPYNNTFLEGGVGVARPLREGPEFAAGSAWSFSGWVSPVRRQQGSVVIAALGGVSHEPAWRGLLLADGVLGATIAPGVTLRASAPLQAGNWYAVAATYDGNRARLYVDGVEVASAQAATRAVEPTLELAPAVPLAPGVYRHFGGSLALFSLAPVELTAQDVATLAHARPDFSLVTFNRVGLGWPWQEHSWRGLQEPQDPWTLPHGNAAPSAPVAAEASRDEVASTVSADVASGDRGAWPITNWHLAAAPNVGGSGEQISQAAYVEQGWYAAVVPGTVLTTLIARGVYPDPDYGLNNMAIPESLSRQDYWYRSVFVSPPNAQSDRHSTVEFKGINYAAEIWLNGRRLGGIHGAFTRGRFDVTGMLKSGEPNVIAVRVSPPPHPGIPHEQSVSAGPGNNGGAMAIDGPTFIATEGWDWIPGIRDRNTGLWQGVDLLQTGDLQLRDAHVVTHLPLPRTDTADILITVPVENHGLAPVDGTVTATFEGVSVSKRMSFAPGATEVKLEPNEFPQLHLKAPRLWWPNGYGAPNLYALRLEVSTNHAVSDSASLRFGIRELTYELSLFDHEGRLRRVDVDPTLGSLRGERLIDVRHEAIKRTPNGWAESLTPAGEHSPAVRPGEHESLSPYLAIRANGVAIAARGGSWGMDDSRKRVGRERLEPYFQLHKDAHLNIIRNWLGQDTEEVFYDLADEYGLLILNDFWVSTQDFQMEPEDPALFLANARDVISRYRNHPSIAVWFGRNEGVPQPIINEGLADLVATLDGTRHYTGSSNSVNLQGSGPYNYRPPVQYFTELARGFSVEVGTPSLSTVESLRASIPTADSWPLNDTYAYHDWHFGGNGDVATFMASLAAQYGEGTSVEDFERKAQLMNYVSYRAIFEGFQAHLWTENSGRLLWMTHPSWPSNTWQIYSSDYDTGAAYYAVKKACEPLHVQMNLPNFELEVVNTTLVDQRHLVVRSRVSTLDNRVLAERTDHVDVPADAMKTLAPLTQLAPAIAREGLVLVKLTLTDLKGQVLSDNVYWQGGSEADQRRLTELKPQAVEMRADRHETAQGSTVTVRLKNSGRTPVLNAKVTVLDHGGNRVLPVYYSDNYVTLLPGESRQLEIRCPAKSGQCARVALRGWNVVPAEAVVSQ